MNRRKLLVLLTGALCTSAALATLYTWIEEGNDHCWTTQDNWDWDHSVNFHFPGTTADTALIPSGGPWSVSLVTEEIGWMQIDDTVTFTACTGESAPILSTPVLTIFGPDSAGYTTVTVSSGRIQATGL